MSAGARPGAILRRLACMWIALALLGLGTASCDGGSLGGAAQPASTPTDAPTATSSPSPTVASTPLMAPTRITSPTPFHTSTPTLTQTFTPAPTLTPSFTPTNTPASRATRSGGGACSPPAGGFALIYQADAGLQAALGCPISQQQGVAPSAWSVQAAYQPYEHGYMVWASRFGWSERGVIYALFDDGTYRRFDDTWQEGVDPIDGSESPPDGLFEPVRGFGKVWRDNPDVRAALGWARTPESGGDGQIQLFSGGEMLYVSQMGLTYIFMQGPPARWRPDPTPF
mgnify:CR=1 FL=1